MFTINSLFSSNSSTQKRNLWTTLRKAWKLFKSKHVPVKLKVIPILSVLYLVIPLDLIPDVLLGLGQLDDLVVVSAGLSLFVTLGSIVEQLKINRSSRVSKHKTKQAKAKSEFLDSDVEIVEGEIVSD